MRRLDFLVMLIMIGTAVVAGQARRVVDFSQDTVGQPPKGFEFGHTAGVGKPGQWVVQADGNEHVLAQIDADRTGSRFPVAVMGDISAVDLDLSVRFKPVSGRVDQAAGLVWRYQDENNYYIVRANAREGNVVLYKVQGGKRHGSAVEGGGRDVRQEDPGAVRPMEHAASRLHGTTVRGARQRHKLYEVEDSTFTRAGKVGIWTKADSVT